MAWLWPFRKTASAAPDPASGIRDPLPAGVVVAIALAGLLSPLITLAGAVATYALADEEQGNLLAGAGFAHLILGLTFLAGA